MTEGTDKNLLELSCEETVLEHLGWPEVRAALKSKTQSEAAALLFEGDIFFEDVKKIESELVLS